ncbi:hypothetical protein [Sulfurimonas sp.]|uniref:hypothetical protein n=1 Tax=Sulfurimonas sp. TaxID=2022749 RepID=UPI002AB10955|nr:hypothetical protein [Sulfurimonas sp.]
MKNSSKLFDYIFSFMSIILGVIIYIDRQAKDAFRVYDFSQYNLYIIVSASLILFGLIWFYTTFKSHTKYKQNIEFSKCQNCKISYRYETLKDGICPTCNIKTIEIDEYYKKYPEELDDI